MDQDRDFSSYFNSYTHVAPQWAEFCRLNPDAAPGYSPETLAAIRNADGTQRYIPVDAENYPKFYAVMAEECVYRNVPKPALYADTSPNEVSGYASRDIYTVSISAKLHDVCTAKELRWLIAHELKHLYQENWVTLRDCLLAEDDSDRAGVQSAGYEAAAGYFSKAVGLRINSLNSKSLRNLALKFHNAFPNFIAHHAPVGIDPDESDFSKFKIVFDKYHLSSASRLRTMKFWEDSGFYNPENS